jgi:hypothetical protein
MGGLMQICRLCNIEKPLSEFRFRNDTQKHRSDCKLCHEVVVKKSPSKDAEAKQAYHSNYYQENKEDIKAATKKNQAARPDQVREYKRLYQSERRKTDPIFAMKGRLRHRLKEALKYSSWKKTTKFYDYIGCSNEELKAHIESQFVPGMSWENRSEWHLDHIMPLNYANTAEEMYELCHYQNLRPMWGTDNCSKNAEVTNEGYAALARIRECKKFTDNKL